MCTLLHNIIGNRQLPISLIREFQIIGIACITAIIWDADFIIAYYLRSPADSIYTLSPLQIAGLLMWSMALIIIYFVIVCYKTRALSNLFQRLPSPIFLAADWVTSAILFLLLFGLSPQIYYLYYIMIIDGLPMQWVIGSSINFLQLVNLLSGANLHNYADFLSAIVYKTTLLYSLYCVLVLKADAVFKTARTLVLLSIALSWIGIRSATFIF